MIATEPDLSICCETDTAEGALQLVRGSKADLALVDLSLGTVNGLELIHQLHEVDPNLPVLVLSMHDEALFAERALRAGARGYIMKQEAINGLIHAIREVLAGRMYASERVSQQVLERVGRDALAPGGRLGGLTDRELEVFEMIGRGAGTAAIADRLSVSVKTIETYRSNIKTKLQLKGANDLVRYATSWTDQL
jgi:DNA-binding NarL/FixJ family response regulator